jgi:hypothetical protein
MRHFAARAFARERVWVVDGKKKGWVYPYNDLGDAAIKGANALLEASLKPDPVSDPRRKLQYAIAECLFYSGNAARYLGLLSSPEAFKSVDSDLLVEAIKGFLTNPNANTRGYVAKHFDRLTPKQYEELQPYITEAVRVKAFTSVGSAFGVRKYGMEILTKNKHPEAPSLLAGLLDQWSKGDPSILIEMIKDYGPEAKDAVPALLAYREKQTELYNRYKDQKNNYAKGQAQGAEKNLKEINEALEAINQ